MKRTGVLLILTLAVGIALGVMGTPTVNAQQEPMKRTMLLKTPLAEIKGKEGMLVLVEFAAGGVTASHYHSGEELIYLLEGTHPNRTIRRPGQHCRAMRRTRRSA